MCRPPFPIIETVPKAVPPDGTLMKVGILIFCASKYVNEKQEKGRRLPASRNMPILLKQFLNSTISNTT